MAVAAGGLLWIVGQPEWSRRIWAAGTLPVIAGLALSIIRSLRAGRMGVDAVAFVSMSAALLLGQPLAAIVVAVMYAGGNVLEDFALARAERDLKSLVNRAPRVAHRRTGDEFDDVAIEVVAVGDTLLVRAGEIVPVDGILLGASATLDEAALTGEPIPVTHSTGELIHSGTINAGETFELQASASAGESTYAGIVRMVTAAQSARAPFIRIADRYALVLLAVTLALAGAAWVWSGDPVRGLAVLVTSTPCPLILAAPVAFIAGISRAARLGILVKGGGALRGACRNSHGPVRQDGDTDRWRRAPGCSRDCAGPGGRPGAATSRLSRAGLASCGGGRDRIGGGDQRTVPQPPGPGSRDDGGGRRRIRRGPMGPGRLKIVRLRRRPTRRMGGAVSATRFLALGAQRVRLGRQPPRRRAPAR